MTAPAITGLGVVTALGASADETLAALIDGKSGVGPITAHNTASLRTRIGAPAVEFSAREHVANRRALRNMTYSDLLAVVGISSATIDSGITADPDFDGDRVGLFVGGNKEISDPAKVIDAVLLARRPDGSTDMAVMGGAGAEAFYPLFYVEGLQAAALFHGSVGRGFRGENTYFAGTSDAGIGAIGRAARAIRRGDADAAVAGGFDDPTSWWAMSKYDATEVMSGSNDLGRDAFRPFDADRDGWVPGDGCAFVALEDPDRARARDARIYGYVTGYGSGFTLDPADRASAVRGLASALRGAAGDRIGEVDAIVVDARADDGDVVIAEAIRDVFGNRAASIIATTPGPAVGHLGAAAGAFAVAVAARAVADSVVPPILNLERLDDRCAGIDWVIGSARSASVRTALAIGRGELGQHVAVAVSARHLATAGS